MSKMFLFNNIKCFRLKKKATERRNHDFTLRYFWKDYYFHVMTVILYTFYKLRYLACYIFRQIHF